MLTLFIYIEKEKAGGLCESEEMLRTHRTRRIPSHEWRIRCSFKCSCFPTQEVPAGRFHNPLLNLEISSRTWFAASQNSMALCDSSMWIDSCSGLETSPLNDRPAEFTAGGGQGLYTVCRSVSYSYDAQPADKTLNFFSGVFSHYPTRNKSLVKTQYLLSIITIE